MSDLYLKHLKGKNQYEVFKSVTKNCCNLVTLIGDSRTINIPCKKISFGYIDGNHSPDYVLSDFYKLWYRLVEGGCVAFDDYGFDLPQVTETIHRIIGACSQSIKKIKVLGLKTIFIVKK
jgi:hypothetical protein